MNTHGPMSQGGVICVTVKIAKKGILLYVLGIATLY